MFRLENGFWPKDFRDYSMSETSSIFEGLREKSKNNLADTGKSLISPLFQITPESGDRKVPLPGVIFGAASMFKDGYIPKAGDSIGGGLWTQGFLDEAKAKKTAKGRK